MSVLERLEALEAAGALRPIDLRLARFCARIHREEGGEAAGADAVALAAALASRRAGEGDVCVPLARHAGRAALAAGGDGAGPALEAPPLAEWRRALEASPAVGGPGDHQPLILDGDLLYLGRYWGWEAQVAAHLRARMGREAPVDEARLRAGLDRLFGPLPTGTVDWQRAAAALAALRPLAVVTGGPGTGKTTTVVRILALLLEQRPELAVRLCAPTGKAAARLAEAVRAQKRALAVDEAVRERIPEEAATVHRLLAPDRLGRFRHHAREPLPVDVLVLDEASMVDLPLMARLLDALPPSARLVLLGDRHQLASVEAGSVLADLCGSGPRWRPETRDALVRVGAVARGAAPPADPAAPEPADVQVELRESRRFGPGSGIGRLAAWVREAGPSPEAREAEALLAGHGDLAWLRWTGAERLPPEALEWLERRFAPVLEAEDAPEALARLERARVLCALREGPAGAAGLNAEVEARLRARGLVRGAGAAWRGRPVIVTANDYALGLYNGDVGVLWPRDPGEPERLAAWFADGAGGVRAVPLRQLPAHATAFALTVHRAQGSEYDDVLLVLPPRPHPLVTRELVYTGVTRARRHLTLLSGLETLLAGCARATERASGLAARLGW